MFGLLKKEVERLSMCCSSLENDNMIRTKDNTILTGVIDKK